MLQHLLQRQIRDHMPVLSKDLSYPLKHAFLPGILRYMTQEHSPWGEIVEQVLYRFLQWQHTGGYNGDVIKPCGA